MEPIGIVMMIVSIVVVFGGFVASILRLNSISSAQAKEEENG